VRANLVRANVIACAAPDEIASKEMARGAPGAVALLAATQSNPTRAGVLGPRGQRFHMQRMLG
jgi:hypothetical protein